MNEYKVKGIKVQSQNTTEYGLDLADELSKILSEQIAKEIDKEILSSLGLEDIKSRRKKSIRKIFPEKDFTKDYSISIGYNSLAVGHYSYAVGYGTQQYNHHYKLDRKQKIKNIFNG